MYNVIISGTLRSQSPQQNHAQNVTFAYRREHLQKPPIQVIRSKPTLVLDAYDKLQQDHNQNRSPDQSEISLCVKDIQEP